MARQVLCTLVAVPSAAARVRHGRRMSSESRLALIMAHEIHVIDSHTAGEPTRVVVDGGPPLGDGPLADRFAAFSVRVRLVPHSDRHEPRGSDVLVGALLCQPEDPTCLAGVIFFNNVGYLGMCGHGMMGVIETLKRLRTLTHGREPHRIAGRYCDHSSSRRWMRLGGQCRELSRRTDVKVHADGVGTVVGDVAWGGNWFFLAE